MTNDEIVRSISIDESLKLFEMIPVHTPWILLPFISFVLHIGGD